MIEVKDRFNGGLDLDSSYYKVAKNAYVDALNISRDSVEGNNDSEITNVVANRLVNYTYHSGGTPKTIGAAANTLRNTVIEFAWHPTGYHSVIQFNATTRVRTKIFENLTDSGGTDILGFTENGKINNINIFNRDEGDILFFLDSLGRPTVMNIDDFIAGVYTPVTRDIIDVAKVPPSIPPINVYSADTTRRANNLRNKLFRFSYRWIYDDNYKSTFSPIGTMPIVVNVLSDTYTSVITNNNVIAAVLATGDKSVKAIEFAMSFVNKTNTWSPFLSVAVFDKAAHSIADDNFYTAEFYNDSTYPAIDVNESILLYDFVPRYALSQSLANGNVLIYGGITEGYDRTLTPNVVNTIGTVAAGTGTTTGNLDVVLASETITIGFIFDAWTFSGIPAVGTVVQMRVKKAGVTFFSSTYTTISGDTADTVADGLAANNTGDPDSLMTHPLLNSILFRLESSNHQVLPNGYYSQVVITPPSTTLAPNSIPTWLWSTERNIGIAYFDNKGRTNGILYNAKITFPAYAENGSQLPLIPFINTKIYHQPPIWAYSYQILFTKEATLPLFWMTVDVNTTESSYIYFDITNMGLNARKTPSVETVLNWTFQDGDRMRLIRRNSDNTVFDDTYDAAIEGIVVSPQINGVIQTDKTFVKIKKVAPFSTVTYTTKNFVIELYRQGQQEANDDNKVYYECGLQFPILNPGTSTRVHGGQVTDQSTNYAIPAEINIYNGDVYFRQRIVYLSENGFGTFNVMDRNFVDFYISAVNSIDGRSSEIDINAKETFFGATIRFGQAYQPNTNINGFNRFYPNNFFDCDSTYGNILRFVVRDRFVRVFQQFKVGAIPLFSQIQKSPDGTNVQVVTDKLLNPIQYYVGDFGIGDNAASLASFNFADYFTTNIKGAICRISNDGIDPISIIYKINSWANEHIGQRNGDYILGTFDQRLSQYIIALEEIETDPAYTLTFDEGNQDVKSFGSPLSYHPEMLCTLGLLLISWKDGQLWTHDSTTYNSFYGVTYDSYITLVFNEAPLITKDLIAVEEIANTIWSCPEIVTSTDSYGTTQQQSNLIAADFAKLEGKYSASFLRDSNSIGGILNGDFLKGNYATIKFKVTEPTTLVTLSIVSMKTNYSPLTNQK